MESDRLDFDRLRGALEKLRYTDYQKSIRDYGALSSLLKRIDYVSHLMNQLQLISPDSPYVGKLQYHTVQAITDPYLRVEQGLHFLIQLRDAEDIRREAFNAAASFGSGSDVDEAYRNLFEQLIEPIIDFLDTELSQSVPYDIGASLVSSLSGRITGVVNDVLKNYRIVLTNPEVFAARSFETEPELVFVIAQFDERFFEGLLPTIRRAAVASSAHLGLELKVETAKQVGSRIIIEDIWRFICKASLVIVDISNSNYNVGYELGVAHAMGKSVILMFDKSIPSTGKAPFDIEHIRHIEYTSGEWDDLVEILKDWINELHPDHSSYPTNEIQINVRDKDLEL